MDRFTFAFFASILVFSVSLQAQNKFGFDIMVNALLSDQLDTVSSEVLGERLKNEKVVLLDAREVSEYEVSHLKGAVCIGYEHPDFSLLEEVDKDTPIVVYCSVGKRSEVIGEVLEEEGFTHVQNLFGGIFDWTNRGFEVIDQKGKEVKKVHPYSTAWGVWVNNYEKDYGSK
ncbi:MAG: rhodanese-like domain-containing protein [Flavobacteriales bacterium]|nr:rhodanese-like domain-containing protein [Flavobacteriales bacterium]